jgi:hypothetical protein
MYHGMLRNDRLEDIKKALECGELRWIRSNQDISLPSLVRLVGSLITKLYAITLLCISQCMMCSVMIS